MSIARATVAVTCADDGVAHNQIGQKLGPKGRRTRQKLIDVTVQLLATRVLRDLTVAEVARVAAISPPSFYVYFDSVSAVVLAALAQVSVSTPDMLADLNSYWSVAETDARTLGFVIAYARHWDQHRPIFTIRNLAAATGDKKFVEARNQAVRPILAALAKKIARAQSDGRVLENLVAQAGAVSVLALLDRSSAIAPMMGARNELSAADVFHTTAFMIAGLLGAQRPSTLPDPH
jgi:AcrR family transcriptional regulator